VLLELTSPTTRLYLPSLTEIAVNATFSINLVDGLASDRAAGIMNRAAPADTLPI
jgi:hypothetical protein